MISQQRSQPSSRKPFLTIAQLVVSSSGLFISLLGIALLVSAKESLSTGAMSEGNSLIVWILLVLALSCIPSIVLSIRWLIGKEPPTAGTEKWFLPSSFLLIIWMVLLVMPSRLYRELCEFWLDDFDKRPCGGPSSDLVSQFFTAQDQCR